MTGPQIIVLATPVFFALIGVELAIGRARGRASYRLNDALSSIGLGVMSQIAGVFTAVLTLGIYVAVHDRFAIWQLSPASPWTWAIGLVAYDFLYYWHHRAGHRVALFWAAHVVHHQSEDYNLSTALRQTSSGWLAGWIFYLPMAIAGFPPLVFAVVALIDLLYQFWVHTEQVGRLGAFDRWFCAPSNHRVHHAVNDVYLDRNYGGVFLVWDRLFGTHVEEDRAVPCVYGTRAPLQSWNPIRANLQVYADLARDSWRATNVLDKLRVWLKPPGWRPADVAARWPKAPFSVDSFERWDPPASARRQVLALFLFGALLAATTLFLWHAQFLGWPERAACALAIGVGLWGVGRLSEGAAASLPAGADHARSAPPHATP
ncbi:MAG: sterol desaturase family protein [Caldimonas sp.]